MIIYIDSGFKCHVEQTDPSWREFDVEYFNDKATGFIEGFRYIPDGESWTDTYGDVYQGEILIPFLTSYELNAFQIEYLTAKRDEIYTGLNILGVQT